MRKKHKNDGQRKSFKEHDYYKINRAQLKVKARKEIKESLELTSYEQDLLWQSQYEQQWDLEEDSLYDAYFDRQEKDDYFMENHSNFPEDFYSDDDWSNDYFEAEYDTSNEIDSIFEPKKQEEGRERKQAEDMRSEIYE